MFDIERKYYGKLISDGNGSSIVTPNNARSQLRKFAYHDLITTTPNFMNNTVVGAPKFYSPIHTPINWQIPTKRREVYLWCRFFAANEPKVAAALELYSELPITDFVHACEDEVVKEYYDILAKRLNLSEIMKRIAYEYYCIGDAFVFINISCPKCRGTGITPNTLASDGSYIPCPHQGGTVHSLTLLPPDWIEVVQQPLSDEFYYFITPSSDLRNIVNRKAPIEIYNRIPPYVIKAINENKPIMLHPKCVIHLSNRTSPTTIYGRSILTRLFRALAYKDKLMQAQWVIADRHILPIRIVKIGTAEAPATQQEIEEVRNQLADLANDPTVTLVTHHAFEYAFHGASGSVLQISKEYDLIEQDLLDGLMIHKAILNGEGPNINSATVGVEVMLKRLDSLRHKITHAIEEKLYKMVAIMQGFYTTNKLNQIEPLYPRIKFKEMRVRDDSQIKNLLMSMAEKKLLSKQSLLESFGFDYDREVLRLRMESQIESEYLAEGGGGEGGGGEGGIGLTGMMPASGEMELGGFGGLGGLGGGEGMPGMPSFPMEGGGGASVALAPVPETSKPLIQAPIYSLRNSKLKEKLLLKQLDLAYKMYAQNQKMKLNGNNEGKASILLTEPEQMLFKSLIMLKKNGRLKVPFVMQYRPLDYKKYKLDFAFPTVKIGIEIDGPYHDIKEQQYYDKERDMLLKKHGWDIYRFKEKEIRHGLNDHVIPIILNLINKKLHHHA